MHCATVPLCSGDHLFYRDASLTFKCMNGMAPTNLSPDSSRGARLAAARLAYETNWTYRAITPLQASEAFYTA